MYLHSVLRIVLLCILVVEIGTVEAKATVSLASFDEEAKLRSLQDERRFEPVVFDDEGTVPLVPGPQISSSMERRRGWFKKLRRSVKKRWKRLRRSVKKRWRGWAVRGARWYIKRRWGRRGWGRRGWLKNWFLKFSTYILSSYCFPLDLIGRNNFLSSLAEWMKSWLMNWI